MKNANFSVGVVAIALLVGGDVFGGEGALDTVKSIRSENALPRKSFGGNALAQASSIKTVEDILGVKGQAKDGMVKVVVGRKVKLRAGAGSGRKWA